MITLKVVRINGIIDSVVVTGTTFQNGATFYGVVYAYQWN